MEFSWGVTKFPLRPTQAGRQGGSEEEEQESSGGHGVRVGGGGARGRALNAGLQLYQVGSRLC